MSRLFRFMPDFTKNSVCRGLKMNEFRNIAPATRRKLVKLMARLAERSYRRGVQQALSVGCIHQVSDWRHSSLEKSVGIDTRSYVTVIERLFEQNMELRQVGFDEPNSTGSWTICRAIRPRSGKTNTENIGLGFRETRDRSRD